MSAASRLLVGLALCLAGPGRAEEDSLAGRAQAVLAKHCHACHGQAGAAKGGFGFALDREQLVARGLVVPGKPGESELYRRVQSREMPPAGKPELTATQTKTLRDWIAAGAPALPRPPRSFLGPAHVLAAIEDDLRSTAPTQRRFLRYAVFTHLYDAGRPDADLETAGHALAKLLNSLSWHARVSRPVAVDAARTIFRIDLRDYRWTARTWERLSPGYPYRRSSDAARLCVEMTGSELFGVHGDWLIANASRGKLYYDLLELPATDKGLERLVQVDVARGFQEETVVRAGFNGSGVSKNNRVLERHDSIFGAWWRSHDFSDNSNRQNIFENPLGPLAGRHSFKPAGGEVIFHLPNGFQGYFLSDGDGRRVEKGPIDIVSDPGRPDRQVEVGLSCMNCHSKGLLFKDDQVRAHVEKNAAAFPSSVVDNVRTLYVPPRRFRALMDADTKRYQVALQAAGVPVEAPDPVSAVTLRYEATLDLALTAGELGLRGEELTKLLDASANLKRLLGSLQARGTIQRQVFEENHARIVANVKPTSIVEKVDAPRKPSVVPAFEGHTEAVNCLVLSADGRLALSGGQDHTVRLWDAASGKLLQTLAGHTAAVRGVALSPDGKQALSCGDDRTIRHWELSTGKELGRLSGHLDRVRAVVFSPDGKRALSGGQDRQFRLWDLAKREPLLVVAPFRGAIHCVAFSPDGKQGVCGGVDGSLVAIDLESAAEVQTWPAAHRRGVSCVVFSPDGKWIASGGEDRVVRLWDAATGQPIRNLSGHVTAPLTLQFSSDGKRLYSAAGQTEGEDRFLRVWDAATGRVLAARGGNGSVWCIAFAPEGKSALTGGTDKRIQRWIVE